MSPTLLSGISSLLILWLNSTTLVICGLTGFTQFEINIDNCRFLYGFSFTVKANDKYIYRISHRGSRRHIYNKTNKRITDWCKLFKMVPYENCKNGTAMVRLPSSVRQSDSIFFNSFQELSSNHTEYDRL